MTKEEEKKGNRKEEIGSKQGSLQRFEDLIAWQKCRELNKLVYTHTKEFPDSEKFGLVSQMRRCSISAASNIAEGFGRSSVKDKSHFYVVARGSLTELHNQCILATDVGLLSQDNLESLIEVLSESHKVLIGLIKSTERRL